MPTSTLTTVGGYVAIGAVGAAVYYVSTRKKTKTPAPPVVVAPAPPVKSTKAKTKRSKAFKSNTNTNATTTATDVVATTPEPVASRSSSGSTKDELSNVEFARQMAGLKEGASLVPSTNTSKNKKKKVKSVKQSKATRDFDSHDENTAASVSSGKEAEESPATSPEVKPIDPTGVADMLETPAPAPTILRLTDTTEKAKPKKAKKEEASVETKKQRQNRKKAEAAKAANAEAEKQRQVLLEKQRRTARIAEGRPTQDGSTFVPVKSAWKTEEPATSAVTELLDTAAAPKPASPVLTEEEQIALATEDSAEWNTVTKKSSKKNKKATSSSLADESTPAGVLEEVVNLPVPSAPKPSTKSEASVKPTKVYGTFTALAPSAIGDDEVEWDL